MPQIEYEDQVVQVPVQKQVQVPHVQTVQKTVEIPQVEPLGFWLSQTGLPGKSYSFERIACLGRVILPLPPGFSFDTCLPLVSHLSPTHAICMESIFALL